MLTFRLLVNETWEANTVDLSAISILNFLLTIKYFVKIVFYAFTNLACNILETREKKKMNKSQDFNTIVYTFYLIVNSSENLSKR